MRNKSVPGLGLQEVVTLGDLSSVSANSGQKGQRTKYNIIFIGNGGGLEMVIFGSRDQGIAICLSYLEGN